MMRYPFLGGDYRAFIAKVEVVPAKQGIEGGAIQCFVIPIMAYPD